jgi:hypothetical protein
MGKNFTGLYLRLGESNFDKNNTGTVASKPKPSMYMIGANWVTVSPGKAKLAVYESYKNLA